MFPLSPLPSGVAGAKVQATGGSIKEITGYRLHTFTAGGTFQIISGGPANIEYLVVAAGGGGGGGNTASAQAGGGGAGGMLEGTVTRGNGSHTVGVGTGGAGGTVAATYGTSGGGATFDTIVATGGGGGAFCYWNGSVYASNGGSAGGSGGGVGFYDGAGYVGGTGIAGQGYAGSSYHSGGGGGGGGGAGAAATVSAGGAGRASSITGAAVTYAVGGTAGGGTVSGIGGGGYGGVNAGGYSGGNGIVIVRYPFVLSQMSMLLHFDALPVVDSSNYIPIGNTGITIDAAQSKFGGASGRFPGTQYVYPSSYAGQACVFGTGDFTIDFWIRFNALGNQFIYEGRSSASGPYPLIYLGSDNFLRYHNTADMRLSSSTLTTGTWYHVAVTRAGTIGRLFINGVQQGATFADSTNYADPGANRPLIGSHCVSAVYFNGWIDELRVIKGAAAWTADFTPPTSPYT